jgi:SAM-dependent methyltransferase
MAGDLWDPFGRFDAESDHVFYAQPRLVQHIGEGAIEALRGRYAQLLPDGGPLLDLMSSWVSHLPERHPPAIGLGMNAVELASNPQLAGWLVHDLNRQPDLPFATDAFTATLCAVSVQYQVRPIEVWSEVARVTQPGGPVVVCFSNRCFPTKAVGAWMATDDLGHCKLVATYLQRAGFPDIQAERLASTDDPIYIVWARAP